MGLRELIMLDALIIFASLILSKKFNLGIISRILILSLLPLFCIVIMIAAIANRNLDFYGYIAVILLTCVSFFSAWFFSVLNCEPSKVELAMYIVTRTVALLAMALFAMVEVLPYEILENFLSPLISKGNRYDILSRPPYQLARFVIMVVSFPYIASFIIGSTVLRIKCYRNGKGF